MATIGRRAFLGVLGAGLASAASARATPEGLCVLTDGDRLSAELRALAEERRARGWRVAHMALCSLASLEPLLRVESGGPLLFIVRVDAADRANAARELPALLARHDATRRLGLTISPGERH